MQIVNCIVKAIEAGKLQEDDVLPSINEMSHRMDVARDTAEKAYKYLKRTGVLDAINGKGHFIKRIQPGNKIRVFLLFNQIGVFINTINDSFVNLLGDTAAIDCHISGNNFSLFKKILMECKKDYDYYVIQQNFSDDDGDLVQVIEELPRERLIVVGKKIKNLAGYICGLYENLEDEIFQALEIALDRLRRYHTISLIFQESYPHHCSITIGLWKFCNRYGFHSRIIKDMAQEEVKKGTVYITLRDDDLVILVERIGAPGLKAGIDVGVLSYNETPLKKIILNGITTISTDFKMMGEQIARLITGRSVEQTQTRSYITFRNSL